MAHLPTAPNTQLGEVTWMIDSFFGTMLPVCQSLLGMDEKQERGSFLNPKRLSIHDLQEYFGEVRLENGRLGFEVYSSDWQTHVLAIIETKTAYGDSLSDKAFLQLVADFVEYVTSLPLADIGAREGALWTDEDIARGYSESANQFYTELVERFSEFLTAVESGEDTSF